jgi:hypothetical protein
VVPFAIHQSPVSSTTPEFQFVGQPLAKLKKRPADARIVKLARDCRIDRNILIRSLKLHMISLPLLADITQSIFGTAPVILVQHNKVSEIDHVNFFELARGAVVAGHDIN